MKKLLNKTAVALIVLSFGFLSCNSGDSTTNTSDTAHTVPGINDSVPSVVNPGIGDTSATIKTPPTNDNNTIMPDSTTIAQ